LAAENDSITIQCATDLRYPVVWRYAALHERVARQLFYWNARLMDTARSQGIDYVDRTQKGEYSLVIGSVKTHNQGRYECQDNRGYDGQDDASAYVFITKSGLKCSMEEMAHNDELDINSTEEIVIYECSLEYYGSNTQLVSFNWTDKDNLTLNSQCPTELRIVTSGKEWNHVMSRLCLTVDKAQILEPSLKAELGVKSFSYLIYSPSLLWFASNDTVSKIASIGRKLLPSSTIGTAPLMPTSPSGVDARRDEGEELGDTLSLTFICVAILGGILVCLLGIVIICCVGSTSRHTANKKNGLGVTIKSFVVKFYKLSSQFKRNKSADENNQQQKEKEVRELGQSKERLLNIQTA